MKRISIYFFCLLYIALISSGIICFVIFSIPKHICPNPNLELKANPVKEFEGLVDSHIYDVQVPIPNKDRVFNKTGIQCVWSSVETLARYAEIKELYDITENKDYKSYAGPKSLKDMLEKYKVKYEMTTNKKDRSLLIKGCTIEKRGVGFDIPGHAMILVHYDEEKEVVKYINNSDPDLKIRTWTMDEFNKRWAGWAFIIYAENDIISNKINNNPNIILPIR